MASRNLAICSAAFLLLFVSSSALAQIPRVDSIEPHQGPIAGGTRVTIRGANFSGATITINRTPVTPTVHFDSEIQFVTPPQDNGIALIRIRNSTGTGYAEFLYVPPRLQDLPPGYITTIAGVGHFDGDGRPATQAQVHPNNMVIDANGNIYIAEVQQRRIRRIGSDGIIEHFAGTGSPGDLGDGGPATEATLNFPYGVAVDPGGNLYIAAGSPIVRRVNANTGIITTIAGTGVAGFSGDGGPALQAQFNTPGKLTVDATANIFVLDCGNARIRRIAPDGIISTFAGNGTIGFSGDGGPATQAQINIGGLLPVCPDPGGLAVDQAGNVYLADTENARVRKIDRQTGIITTFGSANQVRGVTVDSQGDVWFVVNGSDERIIKASPVGTILATFGRGMGFSPDGTPAQNAPLGFNDAIQIDGSGNVLFTDVTSGRVRRINLQTGLLETVAGIGPALINETGPAIAANLGSGESRDLAFLPNGDLLLSDGFNSRLRQIDAQGNIRTVAGNGFLDIGTFNAHLGQEGPATETPLIASGLEVERNGNILMTLGGLSLARLDQQGFVHNVAGGLGHRFSGDGGPAANATFTDLMDVSVDQDGNIYLADSNNNRIRRIDRQTSIITTVAGSGPGNPQGGFGLGTYCGDGGPAVQACLNTPLGVAADMEGNLFIADSSNTRIRRVDRLGIISTFAMQGSGRLVFDSAGNLYTNGGSAVMRFSPDGVLTVVAGGGASSFSGDGGLAQQAQIHTLASGVAIDAQGSVFFEDGFNRRIRAVRFGAVLAPPNATIEATRGTPQTVRINNELLLALEATVRYETGEPAVGVRVDFSAPPASGPSCLLGSSTTFSALTDRNGKAQARCVANGAVGSYTVAATPLGSTATASFSLINTSAQVPSTNPVPTANFLTLIPHSAVGGGYLTRLFVTNLTSNSNQLTLNRIDQNGGLVASSTVTLQPAATLFVTDSETRRTQTLTIEWFAIGSQLPLAASVLFDFESQSVGLSPEIRQAVGSLASPSLTAFTAPVRFAGTEVTVGLAVANPSAASNTLTMKLIDQNGNVVAQDSLTLGPFAQTAFVLHDRPAFPDIVLAPGGFLGSLAVTTADPNLPVSALVVGGQLTEIFSLPVVSGVAR